jgi:hypothetical protein
MIGMIILIPMIGTIMMMTVIITVSIPNIDCAPLKEKQ